MGRTRKIFGSDGIGLMLVLLLVVIVPSACLLWFMNQAVKNERLAVRQKLMDAYRGHLSLAQERLEDYWQQTATNLDAQADQLPAPAVFAGAVRAGRADAVICFDASGKVVYPSSALPPKPELPDVKWVEAQRLEATDPVSAASAFAQSAGEATNSNRAARALQAQARCLVQAGRKDAAVAVLIGPLADERYRCSTDAQGRLIAPNAQLMALELLKDSVPNQARARFDLLKTWLDDYNDPAMSSPQRRFLMRELQRVFPDEAKFPTLAAEDLAARYVEGGLQRPSAAGLRPSSLPGVWEIASSRGRVVLLHQTEKLLGRLQAVVASDALPADVRLAFLPPGQESDGAFLALPAGPSLPQWRLALSLKDQRLFESATNQRITFDIWIGFLVVAAVAALAGLALGLVRRQVALTQLKNDLVANVTHELKTPLSSMRLLVDTLLNSPTLHEQTAREYLQLIAQENLRLSRLIDNFLTFSRIERNKYAFDFREVPPQAIVHAATAAAGERFHAPGCRFEVEVAPKLPPLVADSGAMVTALVNLLDNAYKYSGDEKQITLSARAENGSVVFAVKDNGIGMSELETKRIFRRFYRVERRLSRAASGCGLGLSIVKFIVTAHGGAVRVESEPGHGSTFIIRLPGSSQSHDR